MSLSQWLTFTVDGVDASFRIAEVHGVERVCAPWRFVVTCQPIDAARAPVPIVLADLLMKAAKLTLPHRYGERVLAGVVTAAEQGGGALTIEFSAPLALCGQSCDYRVFLDKDALEIATTVLGEHQIALDARISDPLEKRAQVVQHFESDLDFVARVLGDAGVSYYYPFEGEGVVVCNAASGFDPVPGGAGLGVLDDSASLLEEEGFFDVERVSRRCEDKVSLRDYDFTRPELDQAVSAGEGPLECYEYPGRYLDPDVGKRRAAIRLAQLRARACVVRGKTRSRRLCPGHVVKLEGGVREDLPGEWLVVRVEHDMYDQLSGRDEAERYLARVELVPAAAGYREAPARPPTIGMQTATVTGPNGQEIHSEQHGRSSAFLRWDRRGTKDEHSSSFIRVMQPALSGSMLVPRMGWEVLLTHEGASADSPYLLGRLYNGASPPPAGMPANKVETHLGTQTTPGGGSKNGITLNDTAGKEGFAVAASHDFNEKTENDRGIEVTADDAYTVSGNRDVMVGQIHQVGIAGSQSYSVGASRSLTTDANQAIVAASESVMIGGLRAFKVGGDSTIQTPALMRLVGGAKAEAAVESQNRVVTGAATVLVGGSWNVVSGPMMATRVLALHTEVVAGVRSYKSPSYALQVRGALNETLASRKVTAGAGRAEKYGGAASYSFAGGVKIKGADVVIKATSSLTVKASGITLSLTPSSCTISGAFKSTVEATDEGKEEYT